METNEKPLVNRVAESGLVSIDLEKYFPIQPFAHFDLKEHLFMGLILKEKDFRETVKTHNWAQYEGKNLLVYCSADAIIPTWAYMLVAASAAPFANEVFEGSESEFLKSHYFSYIKNLNIEVWQNKRIVIKGCSDKPVPPEAYTTLTKRLQPLAQSIMFGEPCSTVPIYKKPKK